MKINVKTITPNKPKFQFGDVVKGYWSSYLVCGSEFSNEVKLLNLEDFSFFHKTVNSLIELEKKWDHLEKIAELEIDLRN